MPLTALTNFGKQLIANGTLPPLGWSRVKIPFVLQINADGELRGVKDIRTSQTFGKKEVLIAPYFAVPYRTKHQVSITPFAYADNITYLLGLSGSQKDAKRALAAFKACRDLHQELLSECNDPHAKALLTFLNNWHPDQIDKYDFLQEHLEELINQTTLSLEVDGELVHENLDMQEMWNRYYNEKVIQENSYGNITCMITGEENVPGARIHPAITGVKGAQTAGAYLVSYGDRNSSYCYGDKVKGENVPISVTAAELYGNALNYLLKTPEHRRFIGDTTVLFWSESTDDTYLHVFSSAVLGQLRTPESTPESEALQKTISAMVAGKMTAKAWAEYTLNLNTKFYILGIRPHAARLSISFFWKGKFGDVFDNIERHYRRIEVYDNRSKEPVRVCVDDIFRALQPSSGNENAREIPSDAYDSFIQAILNDDRYPAMFASRALYRIRRDLDISLPRVAIIKATMLKNGYKNPCMKEVLTVALNPDSNYIPYLLGQVFLWMEQLQKAASPSVQRGFKEMYFLGASTRPAAFFPTMERKSAMYISKLKRDNEKRGFGVWYDRNISDLLGRLDGAIPATLNTEEQNAFILGYYHAKQDIFKKNEEDSK